VKSDGPYAYTRHPLATVEIVIAFLFVATYPTQWNMIVAPFAVLAYVCAALIEENYLLGCSVAYYRYCQHVKKRFLVV